MAKQKWNRIGSESRGDWVLRPAFRHPVVSVRVEYVGMGGRRWTRRYRVRIIGPIQAVVMVFKSGKECQWTVGTAKRKAESVANDTAWLVRAGVIPREDQCSRQS